MAMAGVWVGTYMTWLQPVYGAPLLTGLATFLVCAAGNAANDLVDIGADRMNRPDRVLVRGALSRRWALWVAIAGNLIAIGIASLVHIDVLIIVAVAIGLLAAYNFGLKRIPAVGNLVIAVLGGMTFIAGGLAVDRPLTWDLPGPLIPAVFAALYHLVREIVKDAEDIEGDRYAGSGSLPLALGIRPALAIALGLFVVLVVLTLAPIFLGWFGTWYKVITVYIIDLPTLALLIFLWGNPSRGMLRAGSTVLKVGMALGVVALLLA